MSPSSAATQSPANVLNRSSEAEVGRAGAGAAAAAPADRTRAARTANRGTFTGISPSPSPEAPHCASRSLVERRASESTAAAKKSGIGTLPSRYEHRDPGDAADRYPRPRQGHADTARGAARQGRSPAREGAPG